jgi:hypothetical protein
MNYFVTPHMLRRIRERRLNLDNVKAVIRSPNRVKDQGRGKHGGIKRKYWKTAGDHTMVVVAEIKGNDCWLITGFYDT